MQSNLHATQLDVFRHSSNDERNIDFRSSKNHISTGVVDDISHFQSRAFDQFSSQLDYLHLCWFPFSKNVYKKVSTNVLHTMQIVACPLMS